MQKTLTQMNVQLANVISDISGVIGMAILRAPANATRTDYPLSNTAACAPAAGKSREVWRATGARSY
jgi:hypothetical protein